VIKFTIPDTVDLYYMAVKQCSAFGQAILFEMQLCRYVLLLLDFA
jgi:hypothetical protein